MWALTFFTLAFTGMASSHYGGALKPHYYCGRELAGMLSLLCYDQEVSKRGDGGYNDILPYAKDQFQSMEYPWLPVQKARALAVPSKNKRYVVNECCEKPCTIAELKTYC